MRNSTAAPDRVRDRPRIAGRRGVWWQALLLALLTGFAMTGCAASADETKDEIVVAIVSNPQMQDAMELQDEFAKAHPDVNVKFVSLPENEARAKITASVATGGGEFDVVMISNYETPIWAENGWIENLQPYIDKTEGYDDQDFIGSIREALSYEDDMYSVPFYGESSFLVYNEEMFKNAGVTMPENPTWPEINELAATLDDPDNGVSGICLRGLAGWGEVMAPLSTVMNTYGGDCITRYSQGNAAMWYDATAMVSSIEDPASSTVAGQNGYAPAPVMDTEDAGWLYSWSLAIPSTSDHKDAAWDFVSWMTNKEYIELVGERFGWERVPPGSRYSTYQVPEYRKISQAYAQPTLDAMDGASQETSMTHPVPYDGLQFVAIPEFQDLGTRVGQQISAAVAGQITVDEALEQSQAYAEQVARTYQREEGQ